MLPGKKKREKLVIFTRYPLAGKVKTRLIPHLGKEGAAKLHKAMTEQTLRTMRLLLARGVDLEVHFEGATVRKMRQWLGSRLKLQKQVSGDLGVRLQHVFQKGFREGYDRIVVIGTDTPELTSDHILKAFLMLKKRPLVLGPARDGGYYLIGLRKSILRQKDRKPWEKLFQNIHWGSEHVLEATLAVARKIGLHFSLLPALRDIDRPEDLPIWQKYRKFSPSSISIIIPTLNEEAFLPHALKSAGKGEKVEVIVVDGGSQDLTCEVAKQFGARVLHTLPGRARQMNEGAKNARGDILLFLHADTLLPGNFDLAVRQVLRRHDVAAGAFHLKIAGSSGGLKVIEWLCNVRACLRERPYGDHALFLCKETFQEIGGFPEIPLMEDLALIRRLRRVGRIALVPASVVTSNRRWQKLGVFKTTLISQLCILGYSLGISPRRLARWYYGKEAEDRGLC